jgi:hypothetical protein
MPSVIRLTVTASISRQLLHVFQRVVPELPRLPRRRLPGNERPRVVDGTVRLVGRFRRSGPEDRPRSEETSGRKTGRLSGETGFRETGDQKAGSSGEGGQRSTRTLQRKSAFIRQQGIRQCKSNKNSGYWSLSDIVDYASKPVPRLRINGCLLPSPRKYEARVEVTDSDKHQGCFK